jgi:hypothetical protein
LERKRSGRYESVVLYVFTKVWQVIHNGEIMFMCTFICKGTWFSVIFSAVFIAI